MKFIRWILSFFRKKKGVEIKKTFVDESGSITTEEFNELKNEIKHQRQKVFNHEWRNKYPPRHMTEKEIELYKIRPNLQYWIDEGVL